MRCPDASAIAAKCVKRATAAEDDYEQGVRNPTEDWEKNTKDAESRYEDETKKAMDRKAFGKGVTRCGTTGQQAETIQKGVEQHRWVGGVQVMEPAMTKGMEPVVAKLRTTVLPPKGPKGSPAQGKRFEVTRQALIEVGRK